MGNQWRIKKKILWVAQVYLHKTKDRHFKLKGETGKTLTLDVGSLAKIKCLQIKIKTNNSQRTIQIPNNKKTRRRGCNRFEL